MWGADMYIFNLWLGDTIYTMRWAWDWDFWRRMWWVQPDGFLSESCFGWRFCNRLGFWLDGVRGRGKAHLFNAYKLGVPGRVVGDLRGVRVRFAVVLVLHCLVIQHDRFMGAAYGRE